MICIKKTAQLKKTPTALTDWYHLTRLRADYHYEFCIIIPKLTSNYSFMKTILLDGIEKITNITLEPQKNH